MLDELATITPKQLWLTKMDEKKGAVTFSGHAPSIDEVSAFMTALKTSRYFGGVELKRTSAGTTERLVTFEITATVQYGTPAGDAAGAPGAPKGKG
jgi:type IV pilus assembly protein PilN